MSGSFQVLGVIERSFATSEPSPVKAVDGLADPRQWRDWRVVGSLLLKACLLLVVGTIKTSRLSGLGDFGVFGFL
jgi:hypothetical protein